MTPSPTPATLAGHTPGPWEIDDRNEDEIEIVGKPTWGARRYGVQGEWAVAKIDDLLGDFPREMRANARLIAAAPDLLDLVRKFDEHAKSGKAFNYPLGALADIANVLARATGAA